MDNYVPKPPRWFKHRKKIFLFLLVLLLLAAIIAALVLAIILIGQVTTSSATSSSSSSSSSTSGSTSTSGGVSSLFACLGTGDFTTYYVAIYNSSQYQVVQNAADIGTGSISFTLCNEGGTNRIAVNQYLNVTTSISQQLFGISNTPPSSQYVVNPSGPLGYIYNVNTDGVNNFPPFFTAPNSWNDPITGTPITFGILTNSSLDPHPYGTQTFQPIQFLGYTVK